MNQVLTSAFTDELEKLSGVYGSPDRAAANEFRNKNPNWNKDRLAERRKTKAMAAGVGLASGAGSYGLLRRFGKSKVPKGAAIAVGTLAGLAGAGVAKKKGDKRATKRRRATYNAEIAKLLPKHQRTWNAHKELLKMDKIPNKPTSRYTENDIAMAKLKKLRDSSKSFATREEYVSALKNLQGQYPNQRIWMGKK